MTASVPFDDYQVRYFRDHPEEVAPFLRESLEDALSDGFWDGFVEGVRVVRMALAAAPDAEGTLAKAMAEAAPDDIAAADALRLGAVLKSVGFQLTIRPSEGSMALRDAS